MDYYEIGQRIRKYRKEEGLSQEELSEKIGISVTHMSHIETGNTKLSLPVLVSIATVLKVKTDDLLFGSVKGEDCESVETIVKILGDCSKEQIDFITDVIRFALVSAKRHFTKTDEH